MSLAQLTAWCNQRFGPHAPEPDHRPRPFDIPWLVMNSEAVKASLGWEPKVTLSAILDEIAEHVSRHPNWLRQTGAL
jgi:CDP-paratose 2-epimerase